MKSLLLSLVALTTQVFAQEYSANHCEIFLDKANVRGADRVLDVYAKIDLHQLHSRGGVKEVVFKGIKSRFARANGYHLSDAPVKSIMSPIAKDYYRLSFANLEPIHESTYFESYKGTFYVEGKNGVKLATDEFNLDFNTVSTLEHLGQRKEAISDLTKSADYPADVARIFNRLNCR